MKFSSYNIIKETDDSIIVYNSFSKSSLLLEKGSDLSMFRDINAYNNLDDNDKKILIENGFVIENNRDEFMELKYMYNQNFFSDDSITISLVPSLNCNFNCPYCCEKNYNCGMQDIKKYFTTLKTYAKNHFHFHQYVQINLFGGEPLLYISECIKFLKWVKKDSEKYNYRFITCVVTNGSLLTKKILDDLISCNLFSLQITIDSDQSNHDKMRIFKTGKPSFDLLISKINMVSSNENAGKQFTFVVRVNLNNTNSKKVEQALIRINKNNRKKISLLFRVIYNTHAYTMKNTNSLAALQDYYDMGLKLGFNILKDKYSFQTCEACGDRKCFYLMPDLSIWKCINDIGYDKCKIGQIKENGTIELIPENVVNWYKNCMSAFDDNKCKKCKLLPDCLGGCPLYKCKNNRKACRPFDMICLPTIY